DRSRARMPVEPWMLSAAPAQVLLHDAMHLAGVAALQLEGRRKDDVATMMKDRVVIAELHVVRPDRLPLTFLAENVTRLEDLGDEHRPLALGGRREKVVVLPDRAADRARN